MYPSHREVSHPQRAAFARDSPGACLGKYTLAASPGALNANGVPPIRPMRRKDAKLRKRFTFAALFSTVKKNF